MVILCILFIINIRAFDPFKTIASCGYYDDIDCIEDMLKKGSTINDEDYYGNIALHWASKRGNITMIKYLIEIGSEINHENHGKSTPLYWATYSNNVNYY